MNRLPAKPLRFAWRAARNLACALPGGQHMLYPPEALSHRFGRADASYSIGVFRHHRELLAAAGFENASRVLEIGPGRNLGTALLWWSALASSGAHRATIQLWDVHANANPSAAGYWQATAGELLAEVGACEVGGLASPQLEALRAVAAGTLLPDIDYTVCSMERLEQAIAGASFDLVYSHAALEHVREIAAFWSLAARLTAHHGWHSHRIDLADHGRRDSHYLEMLEWSPVAWWLTSRFTPGAINRWRAGDHERAIRRAGLNVLCARREQRPDLPVPRERLALPYRHADDGELRTTAVDIVARLP